VKLRYLSDAQLLHKVNLPPLLLTKHLLLHVITHPSLQETLINISW